MIGAVLVALAMQLASPSLVVFNDDPTWPAGVAFELETPTGMVPCTGPVVVGTERRCQVLMSRTVDQVVRLRAMTAAGVRGDWTAPFPAPAIGVGVPPGTTTILGYRALP